MTELTASLNSEALNPTKQGINNHVEYKWNTHYIQEKITQFFFQLVRTINHDELESQYQLILQEIFNENDHHNQDHNKDHNKDHKTLVYRLIAHTRDIIAGKGEYKLAYMMIYNWAKYDMRGAIKLITHFVSEDKKLKEPYGSWKDVKYFSDYCYNKQENFSYPLYKYLIGITNIQLIRDDTQYMASTSNIASNMPSNIARPNLSLCAKWVPRENKAYGWMYEMMALDYYERVFEIYPKTENAKDYAKMHYRKVLSKLNKYLDTVQIKMCNKNWQSINFNNITSITLNKQQYAISFKNKNGTTRTCYDIKNKDNKKDRLLCAEKFSKWCTKKNKINGKNVSIYDFVKTAYQLEAHYDKELVDLLNKQWKSNTNLNNNNIKSEPANASAGASAYIGASAGAGAYAGANGYMIPMIDTSSSMCYEDNVPLYTAIGLGIRIAEQSKLGKRCITFSHKPSWINMEEDQGFYDSVIRIKQKQSNINVNFHEAMELILHHIKKVKMTADEVSQLTIVVLSDMQFDRSKSIQQQPIDKIIEDQYANLGIELCGTPYKPPRIIFWNLRKTSGFPTVSFRPGVSMISGYSQHLMNTIIERNNKGIEDYTPYNVMKGILNGPRYKFLQA